MSLWKEAIVPGENPHMHGTPSWQVDSNPGPSRHANHYTTMPAHFFNYDFFSPINYAAAARL